MINQISVFVENKPGRAKEILRALAVENIDIKALSMADTDEFGIMRMVVNDIESAKKALFEEGVVVRAGGVIAVAVPDEPGALFKAFEILGENKINIEYMYAFGDKYEGASVIAIRTDDQEGTEKVLAGGGIRILTQAEVEEI